MSVALERIPFAWWNTKVSPPSILSRATEEHRTAVVDVLRTLVEQHGCLLVALTEVRREDVLGWLPDGLRTSWNAVEDTSGERHDFDIALAYDRRALTLMDHVWVRTYHAGRAVRAGLVATFGMHDSGGWLVVAAAHWRSNMGDAADGDARRSRSAEALRDAIIASTKAVGEDVPVLILGDFNAEPFEKQFDASLPTARSRAAVQRHRPRSPSDLLFYNAAWRWLGERHAWDGELQPPTLAGSFYSTGTVGQTSWRTFDQVLVSPSLLRGHGWSLDEAALGIHDDSAVFDRAGARPRDPFDHLPIVGHLRWLAPPTTD
ncbi:endonuclease/exonuclease/phosphatase family protein [Sorangium sp. So ce176]|uniref:endonuclease/exonuclease/phosphatase family protein n=1 Tax=Sorangium sp. So ce176 TaxID=3133286 RepID=UPI003F621F7F